MSGALPLRRRADIAVHPDCREMIRRGALVAISSSGGKDSQAMTILLSRLVHREQLLVVHAPLAEVEWPGTIEHIENTLPDGVPLILAPADPRPRRHRSGGVRVRRNAALSSGSCGVISIPNPNSAGGW